MCDFRLDQIPIDNTPSKLAVPLWTSYLFDTKLMIKYEERLNLLNF